MLRVIDGANQIEDLARVDTVWNLLVLLAGGHWPVPRAFVDEGISVLQETAPHPAAAHHRWQLVVCASGRGKVRAAGEG